MIGPRRLQQVSTPSDAPDAIPRGSGATSLSQDCDGVTGDQVWVIVAGVLLGCAGLANLIIGMAAVPGSDVLLTGPTTYSPTTPMSPAGP